MVPAFVISCLTVWGRVSDPSVPSEARRVALTARKSPRIFDPPVRVRDRTDRYLQLFECVPMSILRLKIDVSGTVGDAAWREIHQFDQIQSADFGPQFGSGGRCNHPPDAPHAKGEWIGAEIRLQTPLLAQYAMSHYLEQERVLDADVE
jgi:hypothetical protein